MREPTPIACSLDARGLERRLAAIAEIGAESQISRQVDPDRQLLRFKGDRRTRERLQGIVVAEAECCPLLHLSLSEDAGGLLLSISADEGAEKLAEELGAAFTRS